MMVRCPSCSAIVRLEADGGKCKACGHPVRLNPAVTKGDVELTKAQLAKPEVKEFVDLIVRIASDGAIEFFELQALTKWLNDHRTSEVPAVRYLFDLLLRVCEDGKVTEEEIFEVQLGIERVLPKEVRISIAEARKTARFDQPASDSQTTLIHKLTGNQPQAATRRAASETIDKLFENPPASARQIMFLRFWGRTDLATLSRREISVWMHSFVQEDQARWLAWQLYRKESESSGAQIDPSMVPLGVANSYLDKVYRQHA